MQESKVMRKPFQELTFKDAFMFSAVMSDPDQCRKLLQIVLEMEILEVKVITEKTLMYNPERKGVRLDVLAVENGKKRRFDIEMQVHEEASLPRRSRYYHSHMDMDALLSGSKYEELPDAFVIFICDYALSEPPLCRYTYEKVCRETQEVLPDGQMTIFLSTKGADRDEVPEELRLFLDYVGTQAVAVNGNPAGEFVRNLDRMVRMIKQDRVWEAKYVLFQEMMEDEWKAGHAKGLEEGHAKGLEDGLKAGRAEGQTEGSIQQLRAKVCKLLLHKGAVSDNIRVQIESEKDIEKLEEWFDIALDIECVEDFVKKAGL